jgi:hypothetical protein
MQESTRAKSARLEQKPHPAALSRQPPSRHPHPLSLYDKAMQMIE